MKKLLIIEGGGEFGQIPAQFISYFAKTDLDFVDAFAGASVGAQVAMAYAMRKDPRCFYEQFRKDVIEIFPERPWWKPKIWGPWFDDKVLNRKLQDMFPQKYGDISRPVIVPAYDFKRHKVKVFDNILPDNPDLEKDAWIIPRISSSAPVYLPVYHWMLDGGLVENLPIMCALVALSSKAGWSWSDISIFAIGTGWRKKQKQCLKSINKWWTPVKWLPHLLNFLTSCNEGASRAWAQEMVEKGVLGDFTYWNPVELETDWDMTDTSILEEVQNRTFKHQAKFTKKFGEWLFSK